MTSDPDHLPEHALMPLEEALQRGREIRELRRANIQPKHIAFVNAYFTNKFDHVAAGEMVGITGSKALEWIETEGPVSDLIIQRLQRMGEVSDITLDEVVSLLIREATREPSGPNDKTVSHQARVAALDKLARVKGGFDRNRGNGRKVSVNITVQAPQPGETVTIEAREDDIVG